MKNVCILLQKKINIGDSGAASVLHVFSINGYEFDEIRVLPQNEENRVRETLAELKKISNIILLLADKTALPIAKRYIAEDFPTESMQGSFGNAGMYTDKKCTLLLLSADKTETGEEYVKNACIPYLQQVSGVRYEKIVLRCVGANEGRISSLIAEAKEYSGDKMRYSRVRKYDEDVVSITYDSNSPKMMVDDVLRNFAEGLGDTLYAMEDISLEEQVVSILKLRNRKISVAESFTGGGIAKRLTSVSGASAVYFEGLNTYNELSKIKRLGVSEYTLKMQGAVSDQTAYEMVCGLLNTQDCDIAIATTGIAGPKSDRSLQPVGLCYIAVGTREHIRVYRYVFDGTREEITEKAINYALFYAYKQLKDI
ncbi:MAG: CinA family protein [Clostridia bacterium]|nr:CinA family protein [Clostridia bacterium]